MSCSGETVEEEELLQIRHAGMYCENRCVYCWRPMEFYDSTVKVLALK
jgi:tRNA wybutosine-synthesizing protein 1